MSYPAPQPAKAVLAMRRQSIRAVARHVGMSEHYVSRVLNGWQAPSPTFRAAVADMLDVPEHELFRDPWLTPVAS